MDDLTAVLVEIESLLPDGGSGQHKRSERGIKVLPDAGRAFLARLSFQLLVAEIDRIVAAHLVRASRKKTRQTIHVDAGGCDVDGVLQMGDGGRHRFLLL